MGVNDCQCLAARLARIAMTKYRGAAGLHVGHLTDRHAFDAVVALIGAVPYWSAGSGTAGEPPFGYLAVGANVDGLIVYAQTPATEAERLANLPAPVEMPL